MNYFTELSIGLTNVWLGCFVILLSQIIIGINKKLSKRMGDTSWHTSYEKKLLITTFFLMLSFYILSIWIPLKIGTLCFYIGISIFILSFLCHIISTYNFASTPENEVIKKGMYKLSRNPLYFSYAVMILGLTVASLSFYLFIYFMYFDQYYYSFANYSRRTILS